MYLETVQLLPLRSEEEEEALHGPRQREASHQQGQHDHVGEDGGEVGHLARAGDSVLESEIEEEPADEETPSQGGIRQTQTSRDVRLLLEDPGPEVLLGAGDDGHVGGVLGDLVELGGGGDTDGVVVVGHVGVVALDQGGHVGPRGDAESLVRLEVGVTLGPWEDRVAGDHQVVDGEGDEGAVVGGDAGGAQDLAVAHSAQGRHHVPHSHAPAAAELTQGQLHEVERSAH